MFLDEAHFEDTEKSKQLVEIIDTLERNTQSICYGYLQ